MKRLGCAPLLLVLTSTILLAQVDLTRNNTSCASPPQRRVLTPEQVANELPASGLNLLISQEDPYMGTDYGYGYGLSSWDNFSTALNGAFRAGTITVDPSDLDDLSYLLTFDRLLVVPRQPGQSLSSTEIANIGAFEATGRRVVLLGENSFWADWDNALLSTVGGSYRSDSLGDILNRLVRDTFTIGVRQLSTASDGIATGGISLYDKDVATLWGTNVFSLLSVNLVDDTEGTVEFELNIARWLASQHK